MTSRRQFLVATGLASGAAVTGLALLPRDRPLLGRWLPSPAHPEGRLSAGAYAELAAMAGVSPIGRGWLDRHPRQATEIEDWLVERLGLAAPADVDAAAFITAIRDAIGEDFRNQRHLDIDGWQVSETEAQVAALRFLLHGAREPEAEQPYTTGTIVAVDNWGPRGTEQGVGVNVQPDGHSGLWIRAPDAPSWLVVEIDGERAHTVIDGNVITSGLHGTLRDRVLATPGEYAIVLVDDIHRIRQHVGSFVVNPPLERALLADGSRSRAFCPVQDWGPQAITAGEPANPQPDGSDGLWIRTECAAARTQVRIDGRVLATTADAGSGVVTARLPLREIEHPREAEISLHDPDSGESLAVGTLVVSG